MDLDDIFLEPAAAGARAGGKFKPKAKPRPKKLASVSAAAELPNGNEETPPMQDLSCGGEDPDGLKGEVARTKSANLSNTLPSETVVPDSGTINQFTDGTILEENADVFSGGIHSSMEAAALHPWTNVDSEKRMDDNIDIPVFPGYPGTQDSVMFTDFIAPEIDGGIHAQNGGTQTEEEEYCLDMETLDIIEKGTTTYGQHSGKFQPKPKFQDDVQTRNQSQDVNETPKSVYAADDIDYVSMGASTSEFLVNGDLRNETTNAQNNFYGDFQEVDIPEMAGEPTSKTEKEIPSGGWEHEEHFECQGNSTPTEEDNCWEHMAEGQSERARDMGKSKRDAFAEKKPTQKGQNGNEAPDQSGEKPPKKFKHSTRRQRRRALSKELLETPDEDIPFLPIREMLQLVDYKEWLEKKEAKEAGSTQNQERKASDDFEPLLNYHTYVQRQARARWSKLDTERFYEGIREFGSDLSMIQQLFPDRTREQMKLKYKSEERRHPMKLNNALATRVKNHYHYQSVMKKLQEAAAKAANEKDEASADDDSPNIEAETTDVPNNDEPMKSEPSERDGDAAEGNQSDGGGTAEDVRSDGGDDEDDAYWNSYQSEL
ncbi:PREDICTED: uncharacterized protein LOC104800691 [Tarenaya hassleriana]|nr:PREDICTED: uncharacterized protein LOC104800691 [Tarenaya hassleriana]